MASDSISLPEEDLEGEINQLPEALCTTQMITKHNKLSRENTDMEREDLEVELKRRTEERRKKSNVDISRYRPLIRAIQENDVKAQKDFLDKNPDAKTAEIDEFGHTIFHLIVQQSFNSENVKLLEELVSEVLVDSKETLEILNVNNLTALDIAASAGNTEAVKVFVKKHRRLLSIENEFEEEEMERLPVHHAAFWGREETVRYLLSVTDLSEDNNLDSRASLLMTLIQSNLHGIAHGVLKHYPELADPQKNIHWNEIVQTLSEKYLAFASGIRASPMLMWVVKKMGAT